MPSYVLFNTICWDGVGDFTHFTDIVKKLRADPKFSDIDFLAIVFCQHEPPTFDKIRQELSELTIPFLYGNRADHERYSADETIQAQLGEADQAIVISYNALLTTIYEPYLKKTIPRKTIGEHESSLEWYSLTDPNSASAHCYQFNLGLQPSMSGIKISDIPAINPLKAWKSLQDAEPLFANRLVTFTRCPHPKILLAQTLLVPAYFNRYQDFLSFVHFLATNQSISNNKDILIYLSGIREDNWIFKKILPKLVASPVKQIEILTANQTKPERLQVNPLGTKTIRIMRGFYLNDLAYEALFQLGRGGIAGVSGDNSLERCVSMDIFPFYWSTNANKKIPTLDALRAISQRTDLGISSVARQSYNVYFNPERVFEHRERALAGSNQTINRSQDNFLSVDAQAMISSWPKITACLKREYNFYDRLEPIMLEGLPTEALPCFFREQHSIQATLAAKQALASEQEETKKNNSMADWLKNLFR